MTDNYRTRGLRYIQRIEDIYAPMLATHPEDLSDTAHAAIAVVGLAYVILGLDEPDTAPPAISD